MTDGPDPDTVTSETHDDLCYMPLSGHGDVECFGSLDKARTEARVEERERVLTNLRLLVLKWRHETTAKADTETNETISAYMYGASRAFGDVLDLLGEAQ